jgi:hypothetical protein
MHPHPLIGMSAYLALDGRRRGGSQLLNAVLEGAPYGYGEWRMDLGPMAAVGKPVDECGNHRAAEAKGEGGSPGGSPGRSAEEWDEHAGDIANVLVDE